MKKSWRIIGPFKQSDHFMVKSGPEKLGSNYMMDINLQNCFSEILIQNLFQSDFEPKLGQKFNLNLR